MVKFDRYRPQAFRSGGSGAPYAQMQRHANGAWFKAEDVERYLAAYAPTTKGDDTDGRRLTNGEPVPDDNSHAKLRPDGQQKAYVVLSEAERLKGFVRPVRRGYLHTVCGATTVMTASIAETYARDPSFYNGTFCVACGKHFPLDQFVWEGTNEQVGS